MIKEDQSIKPGVPQDGLQKSVDFWAHILRILDGKFKWMEDHDAYGEVTVKFKYWNGKMIRTTWDDEISDNTAVKMAGGMNETIARERKEEPK